MSATLSARREGADLFSAAGKDAGKRRVLEAVESPQEAGGGARFLPPGWAA
jgi:hypothetical protein